MSFCIITQSPCILRLSYQALFCLEIRLMSENMVSIRDGSFGKYDRTLLDELMPIQGLKSFLCKYIDDTSKTYHLTHAEDDNPPSPLIGLEDIFGGPSSVSGAGSTGGSSPFLACGTRGPQSPRDSGLRFPTPHTPASSSNPHTPASPHPAVGGPTHPSFNLTSPPGSHMTHPSPSSLMPSSPLNPQPSPHMVHSPGPSAQLYMQSHQDSPFAVLSPANTNWPGSPGMPRPSPRPGQSPEYKTGASSISSSIRSTSTNRSWSGSVPTYLSHEAFDILCRPCPHTHKDMQGPELSPLERFMGSVFMRRQLVRLCQMDEAMHMVNAPEPGMLVFKIDGLQCCVTLNPIHYQHLNLKITQLNTPDVKTPFSLTPDDLLVLEQYFETRVAAPPYKPNCLNTFCRLLSLAPQVLKDMVQIMRLELKPELGGDQLKWNVQLCMRVPPSASPIVPVGSPCILVCRLKILFFVSFISDTINSSDAEHSF